MTLKDRLSPDMMSLKATEAKVTLGELGRADVKA